MVSTRFMILPSDHFLLTSKDDINDIIRPLIQFFGIGSFVYQKNALDGSEIRLSNQPEWIQFFFENQLYKESVFEQSPQQYEKNRFVWAALPQHQPVLEKAREFNIDHGVTFVEPQKDGCEFFFLGAPRDQPNVLSLMLSHLDLLETFLGYFRQRAEALIKKAEQHRIIVADKYTLNTSAPLPSITFDRGAFLSSLQERSLFSPREQQCIQLLLSGYNFKMIANTLNISYRTIETHFEHIKQKTNCHTKAELIYYLRKLNLV